MTPVVQLRQFVDELRNGAALDAPSAAVAAFAARAGALDPHSLVEEGEALLAKKEDVAQVVAQALRAIVGDLDEHGAQAEFADAAAFARKSAKAWAKKAGPAGASKVLLDDNLEETLVAELQSCALPAPELAQWKALRKAKHLPLALTKLVKKPLAPWFSEFVAGYVGHEFHQIYKSDHAESWQSKVDDVPALLVLLITLGQPPIFGNRALRFANLAAARHQHAPTQKALEKLGAVRLSAADKAEVAKRVRRSRARS